MVNKILSLLRYNCIKKNIFNFVGGWTMFANISSNGEHISSTYVLKDTPALLGQMEGGNNVALNSIGLKMLKDEINATQIRIYCKKQSVPRTLHVSTRDDQTGHKVLDFFAGDINYLPSCENSFDRFPDDTSELSTRCSEWKDLNSVWGNDYVLQKRQNLYINTMYITNKNYVKVVQDSLLCDDNDRGEKAGIWQYFIR